MADVTRITLTVVDRYAQTSRMVFHFPGVLSGPLDSVVTGLITLLNAVMIARCIRIEMSVVEAIAGSASSGSYCTVADRALLEILDEQGTAHNWKIPGIKSSLVSSVDHKTVANAGLWATFVTEIIDETVGAGGATMTSFRSSYRTMLKKRNKR